MAKKKSGSTKKKKKGNRAKEQEPSNEPRDALYERLPASFQLVPEKKRNAFLTFIEAGKRVMGFSPEDRPRAEAYAALLALFRVIETDAVEKREANPPEIINWNVPGTRTFWSQFTVELLLEMPRIRSTFDNIIDSGQLAIMNLEVSEAIRLDLPCFRCFTCGCLSCANLLVDECSCFLYCLCFSADNLYLTLKEKRRTGALGLGPDVSVFSIRADVAHFLQRCVHYRRVFMSSCQIAFGRVEYWAAFIGEDEASPATEFFVDRNDRCQMAANSAWQRGSPHCKELECIGRTISAAYKILFDGICAQLNHHNGLLPWKPLKWGMRKAVEEMKDKCYKEFILDLSSSIDIEQHKDGDFYW